MYANDKIILVPLTEQDADIFYALNSHPELVVNFDESPFLPNETPVEFTRRIIQVCEVIFTIRTVEDQDRIIGDCALHHWDKQSHEMVIGGSLFPGYWGKGFMQSVLELLQNMAKNEWNIKALVGPTETRNHKAIRLVEKMGFVKHYADSNDTIMRKEI